MTNLMTAWIALSAAVMLLTRAFPLRAGKCGLNAADVELTVGYPREMLMPALALDMAGVQQAPRPVCPIRVALIWMRYALPQFAAVGYSLWALLAIILIASGYVYLLANRFLVAVGKGRVVVQPALGHWYAIAFSDVNSVELSHDAQGVRALTLTAKDGKKLHLTRRMVGFDSFVARLNSEAVKSEV